MLTFRRGNWRWGSKPKLTNREKHSQKFFARGGIAKKKRVEHMQSTNVGVVTIRRKSNHT